MTKKRKSYSKQFKLDAVKLITEQDYNVSEAARNLGIDHKTLRRWKKQLEADNLDAFPGNGNITPEKEE
jgi:transposase